MITEENIKFTSDGYALLIGVNDYSAFDKSTQQAVGTSDLHGSVNDVRTFLKVCRLLGMKPANIRVLTSPAIVFDPADSEVPGHVGAATEAEITAGVAWLAKSLGHTGRPTGLLTYSGHGDWLASEGLVLCPSDVVNGASAGADVALTHAIAIRTLNAALSEHDASENLTVVLDTCHSGGGAPVPRSASARGTGHALSLTQRPVSAIAKLVRKAARAPEQLSGRVLSAAERDQVAYQSRLDGEVHGVFSWAIAAAMEQWRRTQEAGNVRLNVSYDKLLETAQRLITGLWFDQTPTLTGPVGIGSLSVLQRGLVAHAGATAALPDGGFKTEQIDPSYDYWRSVVFTVNDGSNTPFATVYVFNIGLGSYVTGVEYWFVNLDATTELGRYGLSAVTTNQSTFSAPAAPAYSNMQSFQLAENVSWGTGWTTDPVTGGSLYAGAGGQYLRLQRDTTSPYRLNRITWYQVLASGVTPYNLTPSTSFSVAGTTVPVTAGHYGYDVSQRP